MACPKVLGEVTITYRAIAVDTTLNATVSNTSVDFTMTINGVEIPSWQEQQLTTGGNTMPKWVAMSANLRNQIRAFGADIAIERLVAMGVLENDI